MKKVGSRHPCRRSAVMRDDATPVPACACRYRRSAGYLPGPVPRRSSASAACSLHCAHALGAIFYILSRVCVTGALVIVNQTFNGTDAFIG
ncbi:hypothetical protein EVAR_78303_1 [Eumeta japonica]|uniref:Uncharacterized protein n=1 Tax=Eumeta variegata TaxID=151549 RepID=A0A4C1T3C0_EUMVA|nr:hypothetical protein EVAR_78303_1 [Eumeta japonica]